MKDGNISIRNLYYLLAYSFGTVTRINGLDTGAEPFDNALDLCAAMLETEVERLARDGAFYSYAEAEDDLDCLRGRIDFAGTIRLAAQGKNRLRCAYDVLSADNPQSRAVKATLRLLTQSKEVRPKTRAALRRLTAYFAGAADADLSDVAWEDLLQRRNRCETALGLCELIARGMIPFEGPGGRRLSRYIDRRRMCTLFEKFILGYYRYHYAGAMSADPEPLTQPAKSGRTDFLPDMRTDVTLIAGGRALIIEAKYYAETLNGRKLHPAHVNQLWRYLTVKNPGRDGSVGGLLLYAKTDGDAQPEVDEILGGYPFAATTLDLSLPFFKIAGKLDSVAAKSLGVAPTRPFTAQII